MSHFRLNDQGFTLAELMVSTALAGLASLAIASVVVQYAGFKQTNMQTNQMSEELQVFSQTMEIYLSEATRIVNCGCGNNCNFTTPSVDCVVAGNCNNPALLTFEFEDTNDPSVATAGGNCLPGQTAAGGETLTSRGCKRLGILAFVPAVAPALGSITLTKNGEAGPFLTLNGVTALRCGQMNDSTVNVLGDLFRMEVAVSTIPTGSGQPVTREIATDVSFRNLSTSGIFYGKKTTTPNCITDGLSAAFADLCCSAFIDATGNCLPANQCVQQGQNGTAQSCCSHMVSGSACL